ncbi:MAG TPA: malectin domain-containing carbohydrate-binding protein, partial [Polyangia bacterium]|nr:malectin domain-containing carbohydrate-binding protein [Polyangia bacterium]
MKTQRTSLLIALALLGAACDGEWSSGQNATSDVEAERSALTSGSTQINCGWTAAAGSFIADVDFSGGNTINPPRTNPINFNDAINPAPAAAYETQRNGTFSYTLPGFAAGSMNTIRLHWAETHWTSPLQRLFNVSINGTQVLTNFDVFTAAGGANNVVIREFTLAPDLATNSYLIQFTTVTDAAFINAIEVVPANVTQGTQVHAGGAALGNFVADVGSSGGGTVTRANTITTAGVLHAAPAALYQSQRNGNFTYTVPGFVPGSTNTVRLHFAETHWNAAGQRLFNVSINGGQVLTSFDTFAAAGAMNKAVVREFRANANSTGKYVIQFTTVTDAAFVSGIEVLPAVPWSMRTAMSTTDYQTEFNARTANGYRLTYVDGYTVNGTTLMSAIFDLTPGPAFVAKHQMSPTDLQTQDNAMTTAGFHISVLNGYNVNGAETYAAIWEQG